MKRVIVFALVFLAFAMSAPGSRASSSIECQQVLLSCSLGEGCDPETYPQPYHSEEYTICSTVMVINGDTIVFPLPFQYPTWICAHIYWISGVTGIYCFNWTDAHTVSWSSGSTGEGQAPPIEGVFLKGHAGAAVSHAVYLPIMRK